MWLLLGSIATHVERLTKSKLLLNSKPSLFQSCWPKCSERRVCCNNNSWARVVESASPKLHHHLVRLQDFKKNTCQKWWKQYTHTHHKPNNHFFCTHIIASSSPSETAPARCSRLQLGVAHPESHLASKYIILGPGAPSLCIHSFWMLQRHHSSVTTRWG